MLTIFRWVQRHKLPELKTVFCFVFREQEIGRQLESQWKRKSQTNMLKQKEETLIKR